MAGTTVCGVAACEEVSAVGDEKGAIGIGWMAEDLRLCALAEAVSIDPVDSRPTHAGLAVGGAPNGGTMRGISDGTGRTPLIPKPGAMYVY